MQVPLQIVFRNLHRSDAIVARIQERVAWLEHFYNRIISCRVVVLQPHKHHRRNNLLHVHIDLRVPGEELVVSRRPDLHAASWDIQVTIRDAFDEMRRRLEAYAQKQRLETKHLEAPPHGEVIRLIYEDRGYGFLRTIDGRELYFDRNSVLNDRFDELQIGSEVRYAEGQGENGPQASTVDLIGKQGHRVPRTAA